MGIFEQRENQYRKWAGNTEIIKCLKSILNWSEEDNSSPTNVDENVHDWVNNIVWYNNMKGINPVFVRTRPYIKRGR